MVTLLVVIPGKPDPMPFDGVLGASRVNGRWQLQCARNVWMQLADGAEIVDWEPEGLPPCVSRLVH